MDFHQTFNTDPLFLPGIFRMSLSSRCRPMRQTKVRQNDPALQPRSRGLRPKLLAVSSGGGHWIQLMRIKHAFEDCLVTFVTVHDSYRNQVADHNFYVVNDANRWDKIGLLRAARKLAWIIWTEKPDIVISTEPRKLAR